MDQKEKEEDRKEKSLYQGQGNKKRKEEKGDRIEDKRNTGGVYSLLNGNVFMKDKT